MAISGVIDMVYRVDEGIKLDLMPYKDDPVGQRYLTIHDPTWIPPIGAYVAGNGDAVWIYPDPNSDQNEHTYFRPAYAQLYENFDNVPLLTMAAWYQHGREYGEPKPAKVAAL